MDRSEVGSQVDKTGSDAAYDAAKFAARFEESFRKLWLIAVGVVRNASLADDIVQEAAIVALGKLDQYTPGTNFTAWMGQMVRYVALNQARKERRRRMPGLEEAVGDAPAVSDGRVRSTLADSSRGALSPEQQDFDDRVVRALGDVSETARACLLLRTIEGLDYAEISGILEIPEGTAMSHVHRARQLLRRRLADVHDGASDDTKALE